MKQHTGLHTSSFRKQFVLKISFDIIINAKLLNSILQCYPVNYLTHDCHYKQMFSEIKLELSRHLHTSSIALDLNGQSESPIDFGWQVKLPSLIINTFVDGFVSSLSSIQLYLIGVICTICFVSRIIADHATNQPMLVTSSHILFRARCSDQENINMVLYHHATDVKYRRCCLYVPVMFWAPNVTPSMR